MPPIQPPFTTKYFSFFKKQSTDESKKYYQDFFLSWEDALWQLLVIHKIKKESIILVPEFFCGDVINNMMAHGLRPVFYPVDKNFQTSPTLFKKIVVKNRPAIIVIFHAVGITNNLFKKNDEWLNSIPAETILIEDCVHKILEQNQIKFIHSRHYLIDSLRKVVPIQGSWLYSQHYLPPISFKQSCLTAIYRWQVLVLWLAMQLNLVLSGQPLIEKLANKIAEKAMIYGYDKIGNQYRASPGSSLMRQLWFYLKIKQIKDKKIKQVEFYLDTLKKLHEKKYLSIPSISKSDHRELRGFPVVLELETASNFLHYLRSNNLLLRFELENSPWAKKHKIIYLPLGAHISKTDLNNVTELIEKYFFQFNSRVSNKRLKNFH